MKYSICPTKGILAFGLWLAISTTAIFANPDNPAELEQFKTVVQHMRGNTDTIKALKSSGKVIGNERGWLNPVDKAKLTMEELKILDQENADRSEYFLFLAKNSSSIYKDEEASMLANATITYEQVAVYFAKKWKEWPPKQ